jgi:arsenate reductase
MNSSTKKSVLFLCTGNSCRSQLAEALTNHFESSHWIAFSAGTEPTGYVHPLALAVLGEIGVLHHGESKSVEVYQGKAFDLIITVCDQAEEQCPTWLEKGKVIHQSFRDPASIQGTEDEILLVFREVRDQIKESIQKLLSHYSEKDIR